VKITEEILDKFIIKYKTTFVRSEAIKAEFKKLPVTPSAEDLYQGYLTAKTNLKHYKELQSKTKSDLFYWSYLAECETITVILSIYAELLYSLIDSEDLPLEIKLNKSKADSFDRIKENINKKIEGLYEYKPSAYKSKIELLKEVLK
jgi:hypothetical protein